MTKYQNIRKRSKITAFEIGGEYISIMLNETPKPYKFSYENAGKSKVEEMKKLALEGKGLYRYMRCYADGKHDRQ